MDSVEAKKFIKDVNRWPRWPILPVVRNWQEHPNVGIIAHFDQEGKSGLWWYPDANLWEFDSRKYHEFLDEAGIDRLIAEGWKVD